MPEVIAALIVHFGVSHCVLLALRRLKSRAGGKQGMEARLETKSHRRVSRRSVKQSVSQLAKGVGEDEDEGHY